MFLFFVNLAFGFVPEGEKVPDIPGLSPYDTPKKYEGVPAPDFPPNKTPQKGAGMDFATFYQQVHKQAMEGDFMRFRGRIMFSREAWAFHNSKMKQKDRKKLLEMGPLVLVFSEITWFLHHNESHGGVVLSTTSGSHLRFDQKYYETLREIGLGGKIHAMCALPKFNMCILLGFPFQ